MKITRDETNMIRHTLERMLQLKPDDNTIEYKNKNTGFTSFSASRLAVMSALMALGGAPINGAEFNLRFTRKELRVLEGLCKHQIYYLGSVTIPEYGKRITSAPQEQKAHLTKYVTNARMTLDNWSRLLQKVEKSL